MEIITDTTQVATNTSVASQNEEYFKLDVSHLDNYGEDGKPLPKKGDLPGAVRVTSGVSNKI